MLAEAAGVEDRRIGFGNRAQAVELVLAVRGSDDFRAHGPRQIAGGKTHPAAGAMHQHRLSGCQPADLHQRDIGGVIGRAHCGSVGEVHPLGDLAQCGSGQRRHEQSAIDRHGHEV